MKITTLKPGEFVREPGAYLMPANMYLADPCPDASLTQSLAKLLIDQSPRHCWAASPRLNPHFRSKEDSKFDLGNVTHRLLLGAGKEFEVFDAVDWNASGGGKGAKGELHTAREIARANGKTPILAHQHHKAVEMCSAVQASVDMMGFPRFDMGEMAELVLVWEEDGIWLRTMIDHVSTDLRNVSDLKTTELSAAPHHIGRLMANAGWDVQAAMHERGLDKLHPEGAGRRKHRFFAIEAYEPYCVTVQEMPESAMHVGRKKIEHAIGIWRECMTSGKWPGYEPGVVSESLPEWASKNWIEQVIDDQRREISAMIQAGKGYPIQAGGLSVLDAG